MIYLYMPYDPEHYATNLRYDAVSRKLMWDNTPGQDVIIIQTPYKESAKARMEEICKGLSRLTSLPTQYTEIPGVGSCWVKAVSATEKARGKGCPLNGGAGTYTVFSYVENDGGGFVFEPNDQSMITADCNVKLTVHVEVAKVEQVRQRSLFPWHRQRQEPDTFYSITFPEVLSSGYVDGSLQYEIGEFAVPITVQMVQQRRVYVKTEIKPVVTSQNKGLCLTDDKTVGGYTR